MSAQSEIEQQSSYQQIGQHTAKVGTDSSIDPSEDHLPGEGDPCDPGGPVNWYGMDDDESADTMEALSNFLQWAVPHWAFSTEQFPFRCWWHHGDIIEEMTAWWGLWQAYLRNPTSHIADPSAFHERTHALKQRLGETYRGRCRHGHQPNLDCPTVGRP